MINDKAVGTLHLALSGAAFATILSLLQVPILDFPLKMVLFCFTISLPINIICGVVTTYKEKKIVSPNSFDNLSRKLGALTTEVDAIGVTFLLIHFWEGFGVVFLVSGVTFLVIISRQFRNN